MAIDKLTSVLVAIRLLCTMGITVDAQARSANESHQQLLSNVLTAPVVSAARVPKLWYEDVSDGIYHAAEALYGPDLRPLDKPSMLKYLKNIAGARFLKFEDISNNPSIVLGDASTFYHVKFYYGVLRLKVRDPKLVPALKNTQYRQFTVVQLKKNGPWFLDFDQDVPKR